MRTRVVSAGAVDARDLARWRALADRAIESNAYLDPRWLHTSVLTHPDAAGLSLLLIEDDHDLRGLFAFTIEKAWQDAPFRAVSTAGGFLDTHAERHHPLVDRDHAPAVMRAFVGALAGVGAGLAVLKKFPGDGPLADALTASLAEARIPVEETLRRPAAYMRAGSVVAPGPPPVLESAHASARTRKRTRQYARAIEREAGAPLVLAENAGDADVVEVFLDLQAKGWKGDQTRGGLAMRSSAVTEAWFTRIVEAFAADGDLSMPVLSAGDRPIWVGVSLASGGVWSGFLDAYEDDFTAYRAGNLGRLAELNFLAREYPGRDVDPNLDPFYASSSALYPDRRDRVNLLLAPGGIGARALLTVVPRLRAVRDRMREARGSAPVAAQEPVDEPA